MTTSRPGDTGLAALVPRELADAGEEPVARQRAAAAERVVEKPLQARGRGDRLDRPLEPRILDRDRRRRRRPAAAQAVQVARPVVIEGDLFWRRVPLAGCRGAQARED